MIRLIEYCLEIPSILRILLLLLLLMWKQLECLAQKLLLIFFQTDCSLPKKHLNLPMKKQNNQTLPLRFCSLHLVSYALRFYDRAPKGQKLLQVPPNGKTGKRKKREQRKIPLKCLDRLLWREKNASIRVNFSSTRFHKSRYI